MQDTSNQRNSDINPETLRAFHMMWDAFPFVVMLLKKNRTIVALNRLARDLGIQPGMKCYELTGVKEPHKECLANAALEEGITKRTVAYIDLFKQVMDTYWIPVQGEKDLYIHFNIDITEYAKPELFPSSISSLTN